MQIHHSPIQDIEKIIEHYERKDGVSITYVCTSDLRASDVPVDIFYRSTPHPDFGNRYFGIFWDSIRNSVMICNADIIEDLEFPMIVGPDGRYYYSQSHHDYVSFDNGSVIDGGRVYARGHGYEFYKVKNGEFIKDYGEDLSNMVGNYVYPGTDPQVWKNQLKL